MGRKRRFVIVLFYFILFQFCFLFEFRFFSFFKKIKFFQHFRIKNSCLSTFFKRQCAIGSNGTTCVNIIYNDMIILLINVKSKIFHKHNSTAEEARAITADARREEYANVVTKCLFCSKPDQLDNLHPVVNISKIFQTNQQ